MSYFERKSLWPAGLSPGLLAGIALLFPSCLSGAEQAAPQTQQAGPPAQQSESPGSGSVDVSRDYLSGKITSFASYIDRFFGGDRHYQESNQTVFQLDFTRATGYGSPRTWDFAARVNLRLPITEGRLHLLVETDPEKNAVAEVTPAKVSTVPPQNQVAAPPGVALAVRVEKAKEDVWHFSSDAGLQFHGLAAIPSPFIRTRARYSAPIMGDWRLKAAESVYWFKTIGPGETTQVDFEHIISEPILFRATSTVTWLQEKRNFDLRQDLSFFHTLNDRTALVYQTSAIGVSNPQYQVTDYVVLVAYRYRFHREWLYFDLSPQMHFPADRNFHASAALIMRVEVLFDESR